MKSLNLNVINSQSPYTVWNQDDRGAENAEIMG